MEILFFETPAEWRAWLAEHHATAAEVEVGFRKRASGLPSMTWPEAVDEALCFGWIDGVRHSVDDTRTATASRHADRAASGARSTSPRSRR